MKNTRNIYRKNNKSKYIPKKIISQNIYKKNNKSKYIENMYTKE